DGEEDEAAPPTNLALGALTRQSTNGYGRSGVQAVDGDPRTFTHTADADLRPWGEVDLGARSRVEAVNIFNRIGCCPERLHNLDVALFDAAGEVVWAAPRINPVAEGEAPPDPGLELVRQPANATPVSEPGDRLARWRCAIEWHEHRSQGRERRPAPAREEEERRGACCDEAEVLDW
ncbi:MAG: discoidin domain-containing protein, partial [bacterium]|nr:discoidin domain-containing protein [bacterium]